MIVTTPECLGDLDEFVLLALYPALLAFADHSEILGGKTKPASENGVIFVDLGRLKLFCAFSPAQLLKELNQARGNFENIACDNISLNLLQL